MNVRSIHARLILWYTVLIVTVAAAFGAYTYSSIDHTLYEEMHDMLARRVVHLREDVLPDIASATPKALARKIRDVYSPEENDRFIRISKKDGTVLYASGMPREKTFDPARIPLARDYTQDISERRDAHILLVGFVTQMAGTDYVLEMGASVAPIEDALHRLILTLLIGLPFIVMIAVAGGSVLVRRALQPVEDMRATAQQISFSNLSRRLPVTPTGDAIEHLSQTLNQMLERLDQAYQQASRFSADASHELRTPLAIMRSELEALLHEKKSVSLDRIGSVLEEVERLSNIVDGLFAIARLDGGEAGIVRERFDLAELSCSTLEQMQLLADEKNISVTVAAPHPVFVSGDAARLRQVVVNLLDNAFKYTMTGGAVTLSVSASPSKALLTVRDNGIGISAGSLPHVFERFYRADKVRSRSIEGAGLGLSIVRAICQAHGGTAEITSAEGTGTTVAIELPLSVGES